MIWWTHMHNSVMDCCVVEKDLKLVTFKVETLLGGIGWRSPSRWTFSGKGICTYSTWTVSLNGHSVRRRWSEWVPRRPIGCPWPMADTEDDAFRCRQTQSTRVRADTKLSETVVFHAWNFELENLISELQNQVECETELEQRWASFFLTQGQKSGPRVFHERKMFPSEWHSSLFLVPKWHGKWRVSMKYCLVLDSILNEARPEGWTWRKKNKTRRPRAVKSRLNRSQLRRGSRCQWHWEKTLSPQGKTRGFFYLEMEMSRSQRTMVIVLNDNDTEHKAPPDPDWRLSKRLERQPWNAGRSVPITSDSRVYDVALPRRVAQSKRTGRSSRNAISGEPLLFLLSLTVNSVRSTIAICQVFGSKWCQKNQETAGKWKISSKNLSLGRISRHSSNSGFEQRIYIESSIL